MTGLQWPTHHIITTQKPPYPQALEALQRADDLQPAEGPEAQRVAQAVAICKKKLGGKTDVNGCSGKLRWWASKTNILPLARDAVKDVWLG